MAAIRALLLDIGNVCVRLRTQAFLDGITPQGRPGLTQAEVLDSLRDPNSPHIDYERGLIDGAAFYASQVERLGLRLGYPQWLDAWNAYFEPNRPMEALLARLQGSLRFWTLSNTNAEHLQHLRLNFRLFDAFHGFTASNLCGARKPEPAIYQDALQRLGLPPKEVLYLDDVAAYVEAGRAQGLQAFHYTFNDAALRERLAELGVALPSLDGRSNLSC